MSAAVLPRRLPGLRVPATRLTASVRPLTIPRHFQTSAPTAANPLPITAYGKAPQPPQPATPITSLLADWRARERRARSNPRARFWKSVSVQEAPEGYTVHLDKRLIKTPAKSTLLVPSSKPLLANALALEWNHLRSSKDALKTHLVPLTQLSSRAIDLKEEEREEIVRNLIKYLDTDTILCWEPTVPENMREPDRPTLREMQIAAAEPIVGWLTSRVWKGLTIHPQDGDEGLLGRPQDPETRETLMQWTRQLSNWELVGFERIVYAAKSFLIGARMVEEWRLGGERRWGIEEAAEAASVEVKYQTEMWGEVEDTHDVEKENIRRQIGAGWLLIHEKQP